MLNRRRRLLRDKKRWGNCSLNAIIILILTSFLYKMLVRHSFHHIRQIRTSQGNQTAIDFFSSWVKI